MAGLRILAVSAMKCTPQNTIVSSGASAAILRQRQRIADVVGDVLDRGQLVVVRQHGGTAQAGQAADLGGPLRVTLDPGVAGRGADDAGG